MNNKILGVMVTYNPDIQELRINAQELLTQVDKLLLIDNTGVDSTIGSMVEDFQTDNVEVIKNKRNLGIATALNQGLEYAHNNGYTYFLTVDQDTLLSEGAAVGLRRVLESNLQIASVGATYKVSGSRNKRKNKEYAVVNYLITSGSLTRTSAAKEIGGYYDELFIDGVDFDFSLRLREHGHVLALSDKASMTHAIGEKTTVKFLFFTFTIFVHSKERYFYFSRNHCYIIKRFTRSFFIFCLKKRVAFIAHLMALIMWHPDKIAKLQAVVAGRRCSKVLVKK